MTNCTRCKGDGWIAGYFMPEICPECEGRGEFHVEPEPKPDKNAPGCLFAAAGLVLCLVIVAMWPVIEFFAAVLG